MKIKIAGRAPVPRSSQLTAVMDAGKGIKLFDASSLKSHPGWPDIQRRLRQGGLESAYQAAGEAPLLYLPSAVATHWECAEKIRVLSGRAVHAALERRARSLVIILDGSDGPAAVGSVAEGCGLAAYRFDRYRTSGKGGNSLDVTLACGSGGRLDLLRASLGEHLDLVESVNHARDLVNEPGSVATPAEFEIRAREVAREHGLNISVLNLKELEKQGYNGLVQVGRGSSVPSRMIVLRYQPGHARKDIHLGLLGKGLTFDTGGVSLKPGSKMWQMKGDMAGGSAVLYGMESIARSGIPLRVTAVIVTSQNYLDSRSMLPGDIFMARNGKTIHVDNTDAEGRLILTDGLFRMGEEGATHIVDAATLTGACMRALGNAVSGVMGNDGFAEEVIAAGAARGEMIWRLPLVEEYTDLLKFEIADLNNISSTPNGGAITAALFLREFVPKNVSWAHLDIAGTFLTECQWKYFRPGATGVMVRTFHELARRLAG
jgi:leucyl aminopeptidase